MKKNKKLFIVLIFGCCTIIICFFIFFYFGYFFRDKHDADSYWQAYRLVKSNALIDKTYEECLDILFLNGIDIQRETVEFKNEKKQISVLGKEITVFTEISYDVGWANDWNVQRQRQFFLTVYFDENMKVKFVDLSPNLKGG